MIDFENLKLKEITNTFKRGNVTIIAGREAAREDLFALNLIALMSFYGDKKIAIISDKTEESVLNRKIQNIYGITDKNRDVHLKYCNDAIGQTLETIKQYAPDETLIDSKIFGGFENTEGRKQYAKNLSKIKELATKYKLHFLISSHFATPFAGWRGTHTLVSDGVWLLQLFEERGNIGLNFFGGENDGKSCALTYDGNTGRFGIKG